MAPKQTVIVIIKIATQYHGIVTDPSVKSRSLPKDAKKKAHYLRFVQMGTYLHVFISVEMNRRLAHAFHSCKS